MSKIHYATGGLITPEKSEFSTLCRRKFPKGTSDIMQSGFLGAKNVTCQDCKRKLEKQKKEKEYRELVDSIIRKGEYNRIKIVF